MRAWWWCLVVGCASGSGPKATTGSTGLPPTGGSTGVATACDTLLAARLAADLDLPDCTHATLTGALPAGCAGRTANACAEALFDTPPAATAPPGADLWRLELPRCIDGTDTCPVSERVRCADGTRQAVYIDKAVDAKGQDVDSPRWLFVGDASGASCDSASGCAAAYATVGVAGLSSLSIAEGRAGNGVLNSAPGTNPFHDYNRVFVQRCTGDSLAGRGAPSLVISGNTGDYAAPIFHHGAHAFEATFRALVASGGRPHLEFGAPCTKDTQCPDTCSPTVGRCEDAKTLPDLSDAEQVVLLGFSGSSRGLAHNGDAFAEVLATLAGDEVDVKLVFDAAFSPSLENEMHWAASGAPIPGTDLYQRPISVPDAASPAQMELDEDGKGLRDYSSRDFELGGATREGLAWWGVQEDQSCLDHHGDPYAWHCAEREHVIANHLTTDTFIAHRLLDSTETGGPTAVPVHAWMHSREACTAAPSISSCYNWVDTSYRDRSRTQLETFVSLHATLGEEAPYLGVYAAFATEGSSHVALLDDIQLGQTLGRCDGAMVNGSEVRLVDAVVRFTENTLPTNYWHAVQGLTHPAGGHWSTPSLCP